MEVSPDPARHRSDAFAHYASDNVAWHPLVWFRLSSTSETAMQSSRWAQSRHQNCMQSRSSEVPPPPEISSSIDPCHTLPSCLVCASRAQKGERPCSDGSYGDRSPASSAPGTMTPVTCVS